MNVSTARYEARYGRHPAQDPESTHWAFTMSAPGHGSRTDTFFASPNAVWFEACSEATDHAAEHGWTHVEVAL